MLKLAFFIAAMVHMANAGIIGRNSLGLPLDSRRSLLDLEKLARLDLDLADATRIRKATGYVDCRGRTFKNPILGSGALVGAEDILVTNAHIFIDESGKWREPREECFFQNQDERPVRVEFSFAPGDFEIIHDYRADDGANDYAVIRLKKKIEGAKAFPIFAGTTGIAGGTSFVAISAISDSPLFDPMVPVIQLCQAWDVNFGTATANSSFYADCDVVKGQSGSVNIAKIDGEWKAIGIISAYGKARDGEEYNPQLGAYSFHVAIRDNLALAIGRLKGHALSSK